MFQKNRMAFKVSQKMAKEYFRPQQKTHEKALEKAREVCWELGPGGRGLFVCRSQPRGVRARSHVLPEVGTSSPFSSG